MAQPFKYSLLAVFHLSIILVCFSQRSPGDSCRDAIGRDGTCRVLRECPTAQEDLKKGIRPVNCGFERKDPIVCCTSKATTPKPPNITKTEYWCKVYTEVCGDTRFVVGGDKVLPNEFPHMAAIGYGARNRIAWNCGGTLISDKFVLTAAHCTNSRGTGPAGWVLLGAELLVNTTSSGRRKGQIHPVVRRIRHPGYKPPSKYNDIALLEIGRALTPDALPLNGKTLHPACLTKTFKDFIGLRAVATGWGRVGHGEDGSPDLMKVNLPVLESNTCNQAYDVEIKTTSLLRRGIDSTMMCVGELGGGKDTCQGDSGGPLQHSLRYECMYEIWGITSFGKVCGFANSPSVYTRVSPFLPWIESIVWPN